MENLKVVSISPDEIVFSNGIRLYSYHEQSCCENHYLSFADLTIADFDGLLFDLSGDNFFERVEDFGIRLIPTNGFPVSIPGYSQNNGYYSDNLSLVLSDGREFDITKCQNYPVDGI